MLGGGRCALTIAQRLADPAEASQDLDPLNALGARAERPLEPAAPLAQVPVRVPEDPQRDHQATEEVRPVFRGPGQCSANVWKLRLEQGLPLRALRPLNASRARSARAANISAC